MFKKSRGKSKPMLDKRILFGSSIIFVVLLFISAAGAGIIYPGMFNKQYTAISTINGEFYVGRASSWPYSSTVKLYDVFALQNIRSSVDDPGDIQLIPLTNSLWQPNSISFNKNNIVFSGEVNPASEIAKTIEAYKVGTPIPQGDSVPTQ